MTTEQRALALKIAPGCKTAVDCGAKESLLAAALLESHEREEAYQRRILALQDYIQRVTASSVENAARYTADLAAEKRAGAAAVEGATEGSQASALQLATAMTRYPSNYASGERNLASAYLALRASHAEARAMLSDISARARALLGKATT
jgi:hypothetical protein